VTLKKLNELFAVIAAEANANPEFAAKLARVLGEEPPARPRARRALAVLDPVAVIQRDGDGGLRQKLQGMTLDQLRDIVSEHGMDKSHLVMKWAKPERVIEHILATASARARKGDAFR